MPPTLHQEKTEALLARLTHLARMHGQLSADASQRRLDRDDLVDSIISTMRVIDYVLLERGAYRDDGAQECRVAALRAVGLSTNPRRWIDDVGVETDAPASQTPLPR
jgi:hypothetical protein